MAPKLCMPVLYFDVQRQNSHRSPCTRSDRAAWPAVGLAGSVFSNVEQACPARSERRTHPLLRPTAATRVVGRLPGLSRLCSPTLGRLRPQLRAGWHWHLHQFPATLRHHHTKALGFAVPKVILRVTWRTRISSALRTGITTRLQCGRRDACARARAKPTRVLAGRVRGPAWTHRREAACGQTVAGTATAMPRMRAQAAPHRALMRPACYPLHTMARWARTHAQTK
jgi:hypothetical protein